MDCGSTLLYIWVWKIGKLKLLASKRTKLPAVEAPESGDSHGEKDKRKGRR